LLRLSNYEATLGFRVVDEWLRLAEGNPLPSRELMLFVDVYLFVSVYWALLNLLPVYPLDGGQISRNLFLIYSRSSAVQQSLSLSMWTAIAVAIYGFTNGRMFLGIMFAMLAHSSYQTMQAYTGRGGGFGSPW
ncbi:MAG: site-2 protease family protein, partial [Planctomycetales bacterium]|nr:site-2 protease family protein [Planctomycetales bacterium]